MDSITIDEGRVVVRVGPTDEPRLPPVLLSIRTGAVNLQTYMTAAQTRLFATFLTEAADPRRTGGDAVRTNQHTRLDHDALIAAGVDPASTQPRERAVTCQVCGTLTANQAAHCDAHYVTPVAARRAVAS